MAQKREAPGSGFKPQPRAGPYPELRGQGTVSQQSQVLPELAVCLGGLNGQHLHAHARLGGHCGEERAASGGGCPTGARPSRGLRLGWPHSRLASRPLSRPHSWHCRARRSQSLTCSTPMSRQPGCGGSTGRDSGTAEALGCPRTPRRRAVPSAQPLGCRPTVQDLRPQDRREGLRQWLEELTREAAGLCPLQQTSPRGKWWPQAGVWCRSPAHRARLTCVQVLQQRPEGHGVDLWAETGSETARPCEPPPAPADAPGGA